MQRWALLLSGYDYSISYKPGEQHANADSLSRLSLPESPESVPLPPETIHLMQQLDASPVTSDQIKRMTGQDPLLSKVRDLVLQGFLSHSGSCKALPQVLERVVRSCTLSTSRCCSTSGKSKSHRVSALRAPEERANEESCPLLRLVARYRFRPGEQGQIL